MECQCLGLQGSNYYAQSLMNAAHAHLLSIIFVNKICYRRQNREFFSVSLHLGIFIFPCAPTLNPLASDPSDISSMLSQAGAACELQVRFNRTVQLNANVFGTVLCFYHLHAKLFEATQCPLIDSWFSYLFTYKLFLKQKPVQW